MRELLEELGNGSIGMGLAMFAVAVAILIVAVISIVISIVLSIKYYKYNRIPNNADITGEDAARKILDANGLQHISVKCVGSMLFGNSYSHYFKKVRLRRYTYKKSSITSLAMGAQKSALAVLDKEGDPDMKTRIRLTPLITFGPFMFIPLIVIGALVDWILFSFSGWVFLLCVILAFLFYVLSFVLSVMTLKTEKKAQERAYALLKENEMATDDEIVAIKEVFKIYNIQYINDMVLSALELLYRILQFASYFVGNGKSSK